MFRLYSLSTNHLDPDLAFNDIAQQLLAISHYPHLIIGYFNTSLSGKAVRQTILNRYPDVQLMLASSCKGAMGLSLDKNDSFASISLFVIADTQGSYVIGYADTESDDKQRGQTATTSALQQSLGEAPELIWVAMTPGNEEQDVAHIQEVAGQRVPIFGGSAADNDVTGNWQIYTHQADTPVTLAVVFLAPSVEIGYSFASGYAPNGKTGVVTSVKGREIKTIDHQPAADVYNRWSNGAICEKISGGNVLSETTLFPLGRKISDESFLLSHPESVSESGGLGLFSEITIGETIYSMSGSTDSLLHRATSVIDNATSQLSEPEDCQGVLLVYCAGCMLTVQDKFEEVVQGISTLSVRSPVVGTYTFGEQGCFFDGQSRHGNLMISAVVFGG